MHTQAQTCAHSYGFRNLWKASFLHLRLRFRMNLTSSGSRSKPPFFNYIKPYMVYFKNAQKILRENLRFIRNSESKRDFFTKHSQVNFILIGTFFGLDPRVLKFTNHFCLIVNRLTEENTQNQTWKAFCLRYWVLNSFLAFLL